VKRHSIHIISKTKALMICCGMPVKVVARLTGISPNTLARWRAGARRSEVEPDQCLRDQIACLLDVSKPEDMEAGESC
jgi:transcriptional regulator with XRE-family HTH domain